MPTRPIVPPKHAAQTYGIDVSGFQGTIDWQRVKASGEVRWAYIRCCGVGDHGGWTDSQFERNWRGAKAAGIVRGPYVALHAERGDAKMHFDQLTLAIKAAGGWSATDMPPAIDIEKPDDPTPEMAGRVATTALQLCQMIETKMGRRPIIYSGAYWHFQIAGQRPELAALLSRFPLWTPDYRSSNAGPGVPAGWKRWRIWQYSSSGSIPGISGRVDVNRFDGGRPTFAWWRTTSVWPLAVAGVGVLLLAGAGVALALSAAEASA